MEVFFADTALRATLQQELRHLPDFHRLARKMKTRKSNLQASAVCCVTVCGFDPSR